MTEQRRRASFDMRGSNVVGNTFGDASPITGTVYASAGPPAGTVDDLRVALGGIRAPLLDATRTPADRAEMERRLQHLEEELEADAPQGPVVHSLWKRITTLAGPLAGAANVAQITDLMITVFGGG